MNATLNRRVVAEAIGTAIALLASSRCLGGACDVPGTHVHAVAVRAKRVRSVVQRVRGNVRARCRTRPNVSSCRGLKVQSDEDRSVRLCP